MPQIKLTPVASTNLVAIGYDPDTQTLRVKFKPQGDKPSAIWDYAKVPADRYAEMMAHISQGSFFRAHILPNHAATRQWELEKEQADADTTASE